MIKNNHDFAADALRALAILAVILIHTSSTTVSATNFDVMAIPWSLYLNQASRFAVPLFFLISGLVLELNYKDRQNPFSFYKKRLSKIAVPYFFWSILYTFLNKQTFNNLISYLIKGTASYQLYFIPTIIIFYLIFPLLHYAYKIVSNKFVLIFLGIIEFLLLYFDYYIKPFSFYYPLVIFLLNYFVFVLGMVASHNRQRLLIFTGKYKYLFGFLILLMSVYVFFESFYLYNKTQNYLWIYTQWRPSTLIYTVLLAVFFYYLFGKLKDIKLIKLIAPLSFFVFFIHVMFLDLFSNWIGKLPIMTQNYIVRQPWFDALLFLAVAFSSFFTAYLIKRFKTLSAFLG